eukprot:TRINITY_DN2608_c0_g1_i1.p1 TRINITY_DN2608_c0_g1~~TRINITY_DN2608_c0_g1_i1.p1  ORF type:complete len:717 (+),score=245.39 TRINITY_DN2608_c0_g1_i1:108-2153(+)
MTGGSVQFAPSPAQQPRAPPPTPEMVSAEIEEVPPAGKNEPVPVRDAVGTGAKRRGRRTCGAEFEDPERDAAVRLYALLVAIVNFLGLFLNCLNYGLIPPPFLEHRDAGCAGCPGTEDDSVSGTGWYIFLQVMVSVLTLGSIILVFLYHCRLFHDEVIHCERANKAPPQWGRNGGFVRWMLPLLVELAIVIPHPVVFYARRRGFVYLTCWMFLRVYSIVRYAGLASTLYRRRFDIFSQEQLRDKYPGLLVSWTGTLRCTFIRYPMWVGCILTGVCLFCTGVMVFYAERNGAAGPDAVEYANLADSIWFAFITYTTIGYGDMYPGTNLGKLVTALSGVMGVIIANLISGVLANRLDATPAELEMLQWHAKQRKLKHYRNMAGALVASYWRDKIRAIRQNRLDVFPLRGKAWDLYRHNRSDLVAPVLLTGGWLVGDRVTAPKDIYKDGKTVRAQTQGVVTGTVKGVLQVDWDGVGSVPVRPGIDVPIVSHPCDMKSFLSKRTKRLVHDARVARLQCAATDGTSNIDADQDMTQMVETVSSFKTHFECLAAQHRSITTRNQEILHMSMAHRELVHSDTREAHLAEGETYNRRLLTTQEELAREQIAATSDSQAVIFWHQQVLGEQLDHLLGTLKHKLNTPTSALANELGAIRQKVDSSYRHVPSQQPAPPQAPAVKLPRFYYRK